MTAKDGLNITGYRKCNDLRKDWKQSGTFDEYLRDKFTLNRQETKIKRSRKIWEHFEHKFDFINGLVHYHKFYKETLLKTSRNAIKDGVKILEIRHAFGRVFGDNYAKGKDVSEESKTQDISIDGLFEPISIKEELDLYQDVIDELKKEDPDFELILIVVAFKALGHPHAEEQISGYKYAIENGYDFVTGYDLVNEEDKVKPILYFIDELLEAKKNIPGFQFIFHAGESISRYNENLYDAILLGTKRIGHSVPLTFHPHLMKLSTKNQIGIEVCPISHWILGYIFIKLRIKPCIIKK